MLLVLMMSRGAWLCFYSKLEKYNLLSFRTISRWAACTVNGMQAAVGLDGIASARESYEFTWLRL